MSQNRDMGHPILVARCGAPGRFGVAFFAGRTGRHKTHVKCTHGGFRHSHVPSSYIDPGPQLRGTGGTLIVVWKGHRDRGHPPGITGYRKKHSGCTNGGAHHKCRAPSHMNLRPRKGDLSQSTQSRNDTVTHAPIDAIIPRQYGIIDRVLFLSQIWIKPMPRISINKITSKPINA